MPAPRLDDTLVTLGELAKMLGPGWHRATVWYWAERAGIETVAVPGLPYRWVRAAAVPEIMVRLRVARAHRRHDGHGQHGRPRKRPPGGVY